MKAKLRQLPNESEDIDMEWSLFRSAIIASALDCCGQKWLRVAGDAGDGEKSTPGGTRTLKKLFEQRKMHSRPCCKTDRHLICNPDTLIREKLQLWLEKSSKRNHGRSSVVG